MLAIAAFAAGCRSYEIVPTAVIKNKWYFGICRAPKLLSSFAFQRKSQKWKIR
jgi:hypothetical protein